jgi:hypothetical protein
MYDNKLLYAFEVYLQLFELAVKFTMSIFLNTWNTIRKPNGIFMKFDIG